MDADNTVYLLVGQRGSGKSTYAKRLAEADPNIVLLSRDEILIREFGSEHGGYDDGRFAYAITQVFNNLREEISTRKGVRVLLDTWTSDSAERQLMTATVRACGATRVVACYFVTPLNLVSEWFWKKPGIAKASEARLRRGEKLVYFSDIAPVYEYQGFHECAQGIENDGFDEVIRVDPREKLIEIT
jgi:predicted kinase